MILILSAHTDPHAIYVHDKLLQRGVEVTWFDPAELPARAQIAVRQRADGRIRRVIQRAEGDIDLERVTAIWHRRPGNPTPSDRVTDERTRAYVEQECHTLMWHLIDSLPCLHVPAPRPVFRRAENKIVQLMLAAEVGLEVPETLIGNCPSAFLEFFREHEGEMISKMPSGVVARSFGSEEFFRFTEVVSKRDVGYARTLRHSPSIFQGYVDKQVELRVTVVGDQVFAGEIHSQAAKQTQYDWRHYDDISTPIRPHVLPERVADQCRRIVERLGLRYGAIDLILTPQGQYVFIEINPNGQYLWIEEETDLPISDAVCDLLASGLVHASAA